MVPLHDVPGTALHVHTEAISAQRKLNCIPTSVFWEPGNIEGHPSGETGSIQGVSHKMRFGIRSGFPPCQAISPAVLNGIIQGPVYCCAGIPVLGKHQVFDKVPVVPSSVCLREAASQLVRRTYATTVVYTGVYYININSTYI